MSVVALRPTPPLDEVLARLTTDFAATAAAHDRDATLPTENFARLHAEGLLTLAAPRALGGAEADLPTALRVVRAVAKGEPATALILVMQYLLHHSLAVGRAGWTDALRRRVITDALRDGALINALRVEPDLGTPARGGLPATVARRTDDGWSISGRKIYSTGAAALTWMVVWARTDEAEPRVGGFLVHRDAPGRRIEETWDHLGLRASGSHDVVFEDTPVPLDHALDLAPPPSSPGPPANFDPIFLGWSAVLTAGLYDAVAEAARDWFLGWAAGRVPANLGAPLATLPRYQEAAGRIEALLLANRALLDRAAREPPPAHEANLLKHVVTENAIAAVDIAVALTGNPGLSRANALERHHRDVLCGRIHTPQADVALTGAGRAAFRSYLP